MCPCCPPLDRRALLCGLVAGALAGCSDNAQTGRRQLAFVPDGQLATMADQAWAELLSKTPVSSDAALGQRLASVAEPLARASGRKDLTWEFVVFDSPELNAFVLPNGKVAVFRGMMEFARDRAELGAVVGHEVAHILARHPAERVSQQLATQVGVSVAQLVFGGEDGENAELVAGVLGLGATYGVLLPYSRTHELEADRVGVELMRKAGMEPLGAVRFWERMIAHHERQGAPPEALSTHPADARRLAHLKAAVAGLPA
ncbi:M48 family metallopeptidase [uncultured Phenylobacterium sp.]|uniref:M48 family metallopeptidase n=1 Tax=uncultured Phenylobacterium sp. TaxID=349273 RepID=UPI0025ED6C67|nr:M48 family metallopeptidase [uncultured Phenylobacterium sp.]